MKDNDKFEVNAYTPILNMDSTAKSSKCCTTKTFVLLTIILFVAALLCLHNKENVCRYIHMPNDTQNNNHILKNYNNQLINITTVHVANNYCSVTSDEHKFDCFPRGKSDEKNCEERNCCWSPKTINSQVPWCYYPSNYSNYKVINVTKSRNKVVAFFNLTSNTNYKNDIKILCMDISFQTAQKLRIKVIYKKI